MKKLEEQVIRNSENIKNTQTGIMSLHEKFSKFTENHFAHLKVEVDKIKNETASMKTDLSWLKKSYWIVAGATIATLLTVLFK